MSNEINEKTLKAKQLLVWFGPKDAKSDDLALKQNGLNNNISLQLANNDVFVSSGFPHLLD